MMQRLNALASLPAIPSAYGAYSAYPSLPMPQPVSQPPMQIPEIKTEADLAMFNQFMLSLGRDAVQLPTPTATPYVPHTTTLDSKSAASDSPHSDPSSGIEDFFGADELASLGLAGMPGIAMPASMGYTSSALSGHQGGVTFGSMYPSLDAFGAYRHRSGSAAEADDVSKRAIAGLPRSSGSMSALPDPLGTGGIPGTDPHNFSSFDSLAKPRSGVPLPPATLAPREFYKKTYRHVAPLGAPVSSRRFTSSLMSAERTSMDEPDEMDEELDELDEDQNDDIDALDTKPILKIPIRSLLLGDDDDSVDPALKLPAMRSNPPSPPELPSVSDLDRQSALVREAERQREWVLQDADDRRRSSAASSAGPSGRPHHVPVKRHTDEEIVRGVKRLELEEQHRPALADDEARRRDKETRKRHAQLIRAWMVAVNLGWKRRQIEQNMGRGVADA